MLLSLHLLNLHIHNINPIITHVYKHMNISSSAAKYFFIIRKIVRIDNQYYKLTQIIIRGT